MNQESNLFTQSEYEFILSCKESNYDKFNLDYSINKYLINNIIEDPHIINEKNVILYLCNSKHNIMNIEGRGTLDRCQFLFEENGSYRCKIHPVTSITCKMPHLKFLHNSGSKTTTIGEFQYGRNHQLLCPVKLKVSDYEKFDITSKIDKLIYLDRIASELNVETWLPEIIDLLKTSQSNKIPFDRLIIDCIKNDRRLI